MREDFGAGLQNFEAVWERVRFGESFGERKDTDAKLRHFIEDETDKGGLYEALAQQSRGRTRGMFSKMRESVASDIKMLELELFLISGDSFAPRILKPAFDGFLLVMRGLYISEGDLTRELQAAGEEEGGTLRDTYLKAAQGASDRRDCLRRLLSRVMG